MKNFGSESELNAQLRKVTDELRKLGDELRALLRERPRSLKRALDEHAASARPQRLPSNSSG
jgi:hypothetical protein